MLIERFGVKAQFFEYSKVPTNCDNFRSPSEMKALKTYKQGTKLY